MTVLLGLVFLVAWLLGMVQLLGYAVRAFRAVYGRFSRAAVPPPEAEPPQPRRWFGGGP